MTHHDELTDEELAAKLMRDGLRLAAIEPHPEPPRAPVPEHLRRDVFGLAGRVDDIRNWLYGFPTEEIVFAANCLMDELREVVGEEAAFLDQFAEPGAF